MSARWMPNGISGRSRSSRIAFAAAGHGTIRLQELAMPFSIDSTTAALTASCMPKSSQLTISTRASGAKPSSSLDSRSMTPQSARPPISAQVLSRRSLVCRRTRLVDPHRARELRRHRWSAHEALGVRGVDGGQHLATLLAHELCASVVDIRGSVEADARVAVVLVVPGEERLAERPGVLR